MSAPDFDVVVTGAGPVGAALAGALAAGAARVAVVEARARAAGPPPRALDLRVSALTLGSCRQLEALGVWGALPAARIGVIREMQVWDAASHGSIHFTAEAVGEPALGYVVENRRLSDALEGGLAAVTWHRPARVADLERRPDRIVLSVADGERSRRLSARLLVGADGTESAVRRLAGIVAFEGDYRQRAVVAAVRTAVPLAGTAYQRFLPSGPLAFLPLPAEQGSIVWSTTPAHAATLLELEPEAFGRALEEGLEGRLGRVTLTGPRGDFALRRLSVHRYVGERVALVGDAAHTVHPLAGQGVNLGLLDAATLAELVLDALARGRDPGSAHVLRRYERWRKAHNLLVQGALEGLHRLFGSRHPTLRAVRGAGLAATDRLDAVKARLMRIAMGIGADSPRVHSGRA